MQLLGNQKVTWSTGTEQGGQNLSRPQAKCTGLTECTEFQWEPREVKEGRL